jgi:hypothetical protein
VTSYWFRLQQAKARRRALEQRRRELYEAHTRGEMTYAEYVEASEAIDALIASIDVSSDPVDASRDRSPTDEGGGSDVGDEVPDQDTTTAGHTLGRGDGLAATGSGWSVLRSRGRSVGGRALGLGVGSVVITLLAIVIVSGLRSAFPDATLAVTIPEPSITVPGGTAATTTTTVGVSGTATTDAGTTSSAPAETATTSTPTTTTTAAATTTGTAVDTTSSAPAETATTSTPTTTTTAARTTASTGTTTAPDTAAPTLSSPSASPDKIWELDFEDAVCEGVPRTAEISVTVVDDSGIDSVVATWSIGGGGSEKLGQSGDIYSGTFGPFPYLTIPDSAELPVTVTIEATDLVGNAGTVQIQLQLISAGTC